MSPSDSFILGVRPGSVPLNSKWGEPPSMNSLVNFEPVASECTRFFTWAGGHLSPVTGVQPHVKAWEQDHRFGIFGSGQKNHGWLRLCFALFRHFPDRGGSVDPVSKLTSRLMVSGALRLGARWNTGQIVHL